MRELRDDQTEALGDPRGSVAEGKRESSCRHRPDTAKPCLRVVGATREQREACAVYSAGHHLWIRRLKCLVSQGITTLG